MKDIIIPPYAISIPRIADLNKDLILGIGNNLSKTFQSLSINNYPNAHLPPDYVLVPSSNPTDAKNAGGSVGQFIIMIVFLEYFHHRFVYFQYEVHLRNKLLRLLMQIQRTRISNVKFEVELQSKRFHRVTLKQKRFRLNRVNHDEIKQRTKDKMMMKKNEVCPSNRTTSMCF